MHALTSSRTPWRSRGLSFIGAGLIVALVGTLLIAAGGASPAAALAPTATAPVVTVVTGSKPVGWDRSRLFVVTVTGTSSQLVNRTVKLETRARGVSAWTTEATKALSSSGAASFTITPRRSGWRQARVVLLASGSRSSAASSAVAYRVDPTPVDPQYRATVPVSQATFGVNLGVFEPFVQPPATIPSLRLWDSGVAWDEIETAEGVYDFTRLDAIVARASVNKQKISYAFARTPSFYAVDPLAAGSYYRPGAASPPRDLVGFRNFASALMTRYGTSIDSYETWNEMNLRGFWQGTPQMAADMTQVLFEESRKQPTPPLVLAASISPPYSYDKWYDKYVPYLKALKSKNWPIDGYSVHVYSGVSDDVRTIPRMIGVFERVTFSELGAPRKPIWNQEANFRPSFGSSAPSAPVYSSATTRRAVVKTLMLSMGAGVSRTYWYSWRGGYEPYWSVQFYNGSIGQQAMAGLSTWLRTVGATHMSSCTTSSTKLTSCRLLQYSSTTRTYKTKGYVVWSELSTAVKISVPFTIGSVRKLDGTLLPKPASGVYNVGPDAVLVRP